MNSRLHVLPGGDKFHSRFFRALCQVMQRTLTVALFIISLPLVSMNFMAGKALVVVQLRSLLTLPLTLLWPMDSGMSKLVRLMLL